MKKIKKIIFKKLSKTITNTSITIIPYQNQNLPKTQNSEFSQNTSLISKTSTKTTLLTTITIFDFKKYFESDFFLNLEILAKYIIYRNSKISENELKYILKLLISKNWEKKFLRDHKKSFLILIKIISEIFFSTFENLYQISILGAKIGLISQKEVILNLFNEINRIFFFDKNIDFERINLSYVNSYEHNFENFLDLKKKIKNSENISNLENYVKNVKMLIKPQEKRFKDYYDQFGYKDKYYEFNTVKFENLQNSDFSQILKFLEILEKIYKQFFLNSDLLFEKIEAENCYVNFEINFGKLLKKMNLEQILRFLDIFYKEIILFSENFKNFENFEKKKKNENFLENILNSTKMEIIDIRLYENLDFLKIQDIIFYFYLISKTNYNTSLFLKIIPEIFKFHENFLKKNFSDFSIFIFSLGILKIDNKKLWIFLNDFLEKNFFYKKNFFFENSKKKIFLVLITFSKFFPERKIWLKLNLEFFENMKPNFSESFLFLKTKFFLNCLNFEEILFLENFPEFFEIEKIFQKIDLEEEILIFSFYINYIQMKILENSEISENFLKKFFFCYFEFLELNKKNFTKLDFENQFVLLESFFTLFRISKKNFEKSKKKNFENLEKIENLENSEKIENFENSEICLKFEKNWKILRIVINYITKNSEKISPILKTHLFLIMGFSQKMTKSEKDFFFYFRRKIFKNLIENLRFSNSKEILKILEICFFFNFDFDQILFLMIEFSILKNLENLEISEIFQILKIYFFFLQKKIPNFQILKFLKKKKILFYQF